MKRIKEFLLSNKTPGQTAVKNTFWLTVSSTTSKVIRAIMVIYAARVLGTEQYGIFAYGLSLASICFVFADIGLSPLLIREYVRHPDNRRLFTANIAAIKSALILLSFILALIISPFFVRIDNTRHILPFFAILLSLDSLRSFGFSIFRARNKMESEAKIDITTEIISSAIGLIILLTIPSVKNLIIGYMIASAIGLSLIIYSVGNIHLFQTIRLIKRSVFIPVLRTVAPYAIIGIFGMLMTNIDMFFVGYFLDANAAGLYASALRPMSILYLIPNFIAAGIFPLINQFISDSSKENLRTLIRRGAGASFGLMMPIVVGGIILALPIVNSIFGASFTPATKTFSILLLTLIPISLGFISNNILFSYNDTKTPIIASILGATANIGLNLLLIPRFGIVGSAIATVFAQIVMNSILINRARILIGFSFIPNMARIFFSVTILALFAYIGSQFQLPLLLIIPFCAVIYYGMLYILKEPTITEIWRIFSKRNMS